MALKRGSLRASLTRSRAVGLVMLAFGAQVKCDAKIFQGFIGLAGDGVQGGEIVTGFRLVRAARR